MEVILVTGATGFVGRYICPLLINKGYKLKIICRNKKLIEKNKNCEIIYTDDLFNESFDWWISHLKDVDKVLHLAWYLNHNKYWDSLENVSCLEGTIRLARASLHCKVKHFIGIGTCAEYEDSHDKINVNSRLNPKSIYASSKCSTYYMLNSLFKNTQTKFSWCRLFYLWGHDENEGRLIHELLKALNENKYFILENGSIVRDYLHIAVAAEKIYDVINLQRCDSVNICSGEGIKISELVTKIAMDIGKIHLIKFKKDEINKLLSFPIVGEP